MLLMHIHGLDFSGSIASVSAFLPALYILYHDMIQIGRLRLQVCKNNQKQINCFWTPPLK